MQRCSNCGHENGGDDKFCANCGSPLQTQTKEDQSLSEGAEAPEQSNLPSGIPPQFSTPAQDEQSASEPKLPSGIPPQFNSSQSREPHSAPPPYSSSSTEPVGEDWRMSSLGPPPARRRRLWLWIVLGLLGACLLACVAFIWWSTQTDSGDQFWDDVWSTATAQAED